MTRAFDMKDLGATRQILGMEIFRDRRNVKLWLSQQKYVEKILLRFGMNDVKPVSVPLASHFKFSSSYVLVQKRKMNICLEYHMLMQ
jgi:hypothetical protein